MLLLEKKNLDNKKALNEMLNGSGVFVIKNFYSLNQIDQARDIINVLADTQEQKESHFNAEAEAKGKIHLQQRVWNLFNKGKIFSDLITDDIIFDLMSGFLGSKFICGSYAASRLLPDAPGQEPHIDYPYWDFYEKDSFPMGLNSSFPQNCQATVPLDDCTELSGATAYYPGSQTNLRYPTKEDDFSDMQQMVSYPGDIVFFNGNCWHGAMPNKSKHQRAVLLINFLPKYVKPVEDLLINLDKDFINNCSDKIKHLLGLNYPYPKNMDSSRTTNDIGIGYKGNK